MKKIIIALFAVFAVISCQEAQKEPTITGEKPISDLSIYNLPEKWTNQDGKDIELKELRGKVLVMVMIYTSCQELARQHRNQ